MQKRKISFFIPDFSGGGAEKMLVRLANQFSLRKWTVEMVVLNDRGPNRESVNSSISIVNLNCQRAIFSVPKIARYMMASKPDLILTTLDHISLIALISRCLTSWKGIVLVRVANPIGEKLRSLSFFPRIVMGMLMKVFFPMADGIVGISEGITQDCKNRYSRNSEYVYTVHNPAGVELCSAQSSFEEREPFRIIDRMLGRELKLVTVGRLEYQKDHKTLLNAVFELKDRFKCKLYILGEGSLHCELVERVRRLGIEEDVVFMGYVPDPHRVVSECDLFVLSSRFEGFGNVIVEALANGVPVVATDCDFGPREILNSSSYGELTPVGDSNALAGAIERSLTQEYDPQQLLSRAKDFTVEKKALEYENICLRVLNEHEK